jgi:hypothetical protein
LGGESGCGRWVQSARRGWFRKRCCTSTVLTSLRKKRKRGEMKRRERMWERVRGEQGLVQG